MADLKMAVGLALAKAWRSKVSNQSVEQPPPFRPFVSLELRWRGGNGDDFLSRVS